MTSSTNSPKPLPDLVPSQRGFTAGDYPVKKFQAQDGAEVRMNYGNKRYGMTLTLGYDNIPDKAAERFLNHYHYEAEGTFKTFDIGTNARDGWSRDDKWMGAVFWGCRWRYAGPPQLTSVYPGRSSVQIQLYAALNPS